MISASDISATSKEFPTLILEKKKETAKAYLGQKVTHAVSTFPPT